MSDKMTSGEIAKEAGISQKAICLYDRKGLLKPSDYTEGNYRLYDKEALLILEKIIALKQIGFSLEEIRDRLSSEETQDIEKVLQEQVRMLEEKKRNELRAKLEQYFGKVESVLLPNNWHYSAADDLFEKLCNDYQEQEKILKKYESCLKQYFTEKIEVEGEIVVTINSQFWHCYK